MFCRRRAPGRQTERMGEVAKRGEASRRRSHEKEGENEKREVDRTDTSKGILFLYRGNFLFPYPALNIICEAFELIGEQKRCC